MTENQETSDRHRQNEPADDLKDVESDHREGIKANRPADDARSARDNRPAIGGAGSDAALRSDTDRSDA